MREDIKAQNSSVGENAADFVGALIVESERAAVILGAAKVEVELERLIKKALHHNPDGDDQLFDGDRALGTFSAKIYASYRMGLIEDGLREALDIVRRIRNFFAHSIETATLADTPHSDRIRRLAELTENHRIATTTSGALLEKGFSREIAIFAATIAASIASIELYTDYVSPCEMNIPASLTW